MKFGKRIAMFTCLMSMMAMNPAYAADEIAFKLSAPDKEITDAEFTVTLKGENIVDLYAYEAKFSFDPSRLEVVKAESDIKGFSVSPIVKQNEIVFAHTKIGNVDGEKGDLDLGRITFKAKKAGSSALTWTSLKTVDHNLKDKAHTLKETYEFTKVFSDLAGYWSKADVMEMTDRGIVDGVEDDRFAPDDHVTRAQFATLVTRALKLQNSASEIPFTDVSAGAWYEDTVKKAYEAGLIQGVSDTEFAPERRITREEMTAMLMRAKAYSSHTEEVELAVSSSAHFDDQELISDWAKVSVDFAVHTGLMNGRTDTEFAPKENATRAESAVVLKRLLAMQLTS